LNVLIDQGYMKPEVFKQKFSEGLKNDLVKWFVKKFKKQVEGNIYFSYATSGSHKVHKLKYITRATWRFYNKEICDIINGYRTTSTWGKWEKNDIERVSKLVSLEAGVCPCCGFPVQWRKEFVRRESFIQMNIKHIAAGYYMINSS